MLDEDEAAALAALLEELAARHRLDPLSGPALQAAALLRRRVAAEHGHAIWLGAGSPATRRAAGDTRDDTADHRDACAGQRDRRADERDDRARERDRQANVADQGARAGEQRVRDLLSDAERREKAAAAPPPASDGAVRQWQLDRKMAEAGRARNREDREAIREALSQGRAARQAAWRGR
jgi:hypothetical protein